MAVLNLTTLSGCNSIPSFIGGEGDTPANPAYMIFNNTSAPTSWVKNTAHNNKALRIIGGANGTALSPGGSLSFTSALSSGKTYPGSAAEQTTVSASLTQAPSGFTDTGGAGPGSVNTSSHTASVPTMAAHSHPYVTNPGTNPNLNSTETAPSPLTDVLAAAAPTVSGNTGSEGSNTPHNHSVSFPHTHVISVTQHDHPVSTTQHGHSLTISEDFSVRYVDVIIAKKS